MKLILAIFLKCSQEESSFWQVFDNFGLDVALDWFYNNVQAAKQNPRVSYRGDKETAKV